MWVGQVTKFGVIEDEGLAAKLGYESPSVVLFRHGDETNVTFPLAEANLDDIYEFMRWVQVQV